MAVDNKTAVSVIIPVHNSETYLKECMDSIICQTLKEIEIICVDSSSDNSAEILHQYQKTDGRIKVIEDDNPSYGHKLNVGIQKARGEFIAIVESDDYIADSMLDKLYEVGHRYQVDFVKANFKGFIGTSENRRFCVSAGMKESCYGRMILLQEESEIMPYIGYNIWSGLYRTGFLKKEHIRFHESEGASYQDTGFANLVIMKAKKVYFLEDALYKYRLDNEGSSVKSDKKYKCICDEFAWLRRKMYELNCEDDKSRALFGITKLRSYFWNYQRLSEMYQDQFLAHISGEDLRDFDESVLKYMIPDKEHVLNILEGNTESRKLQKDLQARIDVMIAELLDIFINCKEIVIVCAGRYGVAAYKAARIFGKSNDISICDNYVDACMIEGMQVISIEEAVRNHSKAQFVIASKRYGKDLMSQISGLGIAKERISLCNYMITGFEILRAYSRLENQDCQKRKSEYIC